MTQLEAARLEADRWRAGIRSGRIECLCRKRHNYPVNEHVGYPPHDRGRVGICAWVYAVGRVYEIERLLARSDA